MDKFWGKINKKQSCWEWQGALRAGYGAYKYKGKVVAAHRFIWELKNGTIPKGLFVCHKCDNPKCVNPSHLFLGTPKDNVIDAIKKGRINPKKQKGIRTFKPSPVAKLTKVLVKEIRGRYLKGDTTYRQLAKEYKVSRQTICDAIKGTFNYY